MNSPASSVLRVRIGYSGNYTGRRIICARSREKTWFLVDNNETRDHFELASMTTKKNRKGPFGGSIGPQTSAWSLSRNHGNSVCVLEGDGDVMNLP